MPEAEDEVPGATDELVAALAGGAALSFEPDADDDDLLPGDRVARAEAAVAEAAARGDARRRSPPSSPARPPRRSRTIPGRSAGRLSRRPARPVDRRSPRPTHHDGGPGTGRRENRRPTGMADISAELVKELRERTGAGFMDCKRALTEADGDLDKAVALLRERGLAAAAKKAGREAREGLVSQLHPHRWPRRRADRGQLRDRLRGPHR